MIQIAYTTCPVCGNTEADSYEDSWPTHYYEISCAKCGYFHALETYPSQPKYLAEQVERIKKDAVRVLEHMAAQEGGNLTIQTSTQKTADGLSYNVTLFTGDTMADSGGNDGSEVN